MLWCFNHVTYLDYLRLTTSRFRPSQSQGHVVNPSRNDVSVQLFALHIKEHFNKRWCQSSATAETSKTDCPWRPKKDTGDWLLPQITSELFQLRIPVNKHFLLGTYIYIYICGPYTKEASTPPCHDSAKRISPLVPLQGSCPPPLRSAYCSPESISGRSGETCRRGDAVTLQIVESLPVCDLKMCDRTMLNLHGNPGSRGFCLCFHTSRSASMVPFTLWLASFILVGCIINKSCHFASQYCHPL